MGPGYEARSQRMGSKATVKTSCRQWLSQEKVFARARRGMGGVVILALRKSSGVAALAITGTAIACTS